MPDYVIQQVSQPRTWEGKYGPMVSYDLLIDGIEGKVELSQKPSTPAPKVGDTLHGALTTDNNGFKKFKKEQKASFGNGGGRANPEDMRQRAAQGALSNAVATVPGGTNSADILKVAERYYAWIRAKAEGK